MRIRAALSPAVARLADDPRLDRWARPAADSVRRRLGHQPAKDVLSGTWLGHPLHPLLTDLPIGFWTSAVVLDLLGGRAARRAATQLVALGVATAVPTALTGAADWGDTTGSARRVGFVHAAANTAALACFTGSWWARVRGRRARGIALGLAGAGAATVGGYLGGHLLLILGIGVNRSAQPRPPAEWTRVAAADVVDDTPMRVRAGDAPIVLLRHDELVVALDARCPHRGAPMDEGEVRDGCITCPWHGSRFRIDDGTLVRGPATVDLPAYECRIGPAGAEVRDR